MGILYMIRHGQASFGSANYDLFSETGVLQSRILAEYLLAVGLAPDALYSGAMERQKDTAGEDPSLKEDLWKMGTATYFPRENRWLSPFSSCRDERSKY